MSEKNITLRDIYSMSDDEAHHFLRDCRFQPSDTAPECPKCLSRNFYYLEERRIFKCRRCYCQYSISSGSLLGSRKLSYQDLIAFAFIFANAAKGMSSCQLSRTLGHDYKTAFQLAHRFRHALMCEIDMLSLKGEIEIDGAVFGGHLRHANLKHHGKRVRFTKKMTANKRVVIVAHERGGRTIPFVGHRESDAVRDIAMTVEPDSILYADQARSWNKLSRLFKMLRINHHNAFSFAGACTNNAESFFSQLRKLHNGTHHKISGELLRAYACEIAWRRDFSDLSPIERTQRMLTAALQPTKLRMRWSQNLTSEPSQGAEIIRLHPRSPKSINLPLTASQEKSLPIALFPEDAA